MKRVSSPLGVALSFVLLSAVCGPAGPAAARCAEPARILKYALQQPEFEREFRERIDAGFRLIDVSVCVRDRQYVFAGIWEQRGTPEMRYQAGFTSQQFLDENAKFEQEGFRVAHFCSVVADGATYHNAIWDKTADAPRIVELDMSRAELDRRVSDRAGGHRLLRVSAVEQQQGPRFGAAWVKDEASPPQKLEAEVPFGNLERRIAVLQRDGFRPVQVCGFVVEGIDHYAVLAEKRDRPPREVSVRLTDLGLKEAEERMRRRGFVPVQASVYAIRELDRYVVLWEKRAGDAP